MDKRRSHEQIVRLLRDADRELTKGLTVADVCRKHKITKATFLGPIRHKLRVLLLIFDFDLGETATVFLKVTNLN